MANDCGSWKIVTAVLVVILIIVGYMYWNNTNRIERMNTQELMPISHAFNGTAWTDAPVVGKYQDINNQDFINKYNGSNGNGNGDSNNGNGNGNGNGNNGNGNNGNGDSNNGNGNGNGNNGNGNNGNGDSNSGNGNRNKSNNINHIYPYNADNCPPCVCPDNDELKRLSEELGNKFQQLLNKIK